MSAPFLLKAQLTDALIEAIARMPPSESVVHALAHVAEQSLRAQWRRTTGVALEHLFALGSEGAAAVERVWLEITVWNALERKDLAAAARLVNAAMSRPELLVEWIRRAHRHHPTLLERPELDAGRLRALAGLPPCG